MKVSIKADSIPYPELKFRLYLVAVLLLANGSLFAFQGEFATPKSSVEFLKKNTDSVNLNLLEASKLIPSNVILRNSKRKEAILDIRNYLNAIEFDWELDSIPDSANYVVEKGNSAYILTTGIAFEKHNNDWLISKQTIKNIHELLKSVGVEVTAPVKPKKKEPQEEKQSPKIEKKEKKKEELPAIRLDLSSPRSLIAAFGKYMREDNYRPDVVQQIIYYKHLTHKEARIDRVVKLKRFLEGKGVLVNIEDVPDDPDYIDTVHSNTHEYVVTSRFAELYLEKVGDRWYLSKETVDKIPELFELAFPFGSDRLLQYLPNNQTKYMGLMVWQYLAILAMIVISFAFHRLLNWIVYNLITKILFKVGKEEIADDYVKPVVRPLSIMMGLVLVDMFLPILQLPLQLSYYLSLAIAAVIPFMGTLGVYKFVDLISLYLRRVASKTESTLDDQLVPLFRKILKTFVIIIGSVIVLSNLNVQLMPLLATLSIGGFAFALAAQDTIKNFFGSLMIFIDKPFQVGQWITASGIDGTVEEVGIRSTRIRTFSNSLIYVPNGKLADATIDNHGLRSYRRFTTQLALTYDTPPELIEIFIEGLRKLVNEHPHTWKENYHIYMNDMNSHSLDVMFYIFFSVPTWAEELKCRHEIILSILKLAHRLGVNFAFPTQTLHVQDLPGQPSLSPHYAKPDKLSKEMEDFFKTNKPDK